MLNIRASRQMWQAGTTGQGAGCNCRAQIGAHAVNRAAGTSSTGGKKRRRRGSGNGRITQDLSEGTQGSRRHRPGSHKCASPGEGLGGESSNAVLWALGGGWGSCSSAYRQSAVPCIYIVAFPLYEMELSAAEMRVPAQCVTRSWRPPLPRHSRGPLHANARNRRVRCSADPAQAPRCSRRHTAIAAAALLAAAWPSSSPARAAGLSSRPSSLDNAEFYSRFPYVQPADILPYLRAAATPGDVDSVLRAIDEFASHFPMYRWAEVERCLGAVYTFSGFYCCYFYCCSVPVQLLLLLLLLWLLSKGTPWPAPLLLLLLFSFWRALHQPAPQQQHQRQGAPSAPP